MKTFYSHQSRYLSFIILVLFVTSTIPNFQNVLPVQAETDRSPSQPYLVKDLYPGENSEISRPWGGITINNIHYFSATNPEGGYDLWKTDGSNEGTILLQANILPEAGKCFGEGKDFLIFTGEDSEHGTELWLSDGSSDGTHLLIDINPGPGSSSPYNLTKVGNKVFFIANDGTHGNELWTTDGTVKGTNMVIDADPDWNGLGENGEIELVAYGNQVIYTSVPYKFTEGNDSLKIWHSDGTPENTAPFFSVTPNYQSEYSFLYGSNYIELIPFNGKIYFTISIDVNGPRLWYTDGTPEGTHGINIYSYDGSGEIYYPTSLEDLTTAGDNLFFKTTTDTIWNVKAKNNDVVWAGSPYCLDPVHYQSKCKYGSLVGFTNGNVLYDVDRGDTKGTRWWMLDGGYNRYWEVCPDCKYSLNYPSSITWQGRTYYSALNTDPDHDHGTELWVTDGTENGTFEFSDINQGSGSSNPGNFVSAGRFLYFSADDGVHGDELWAIKSPTVVSTNFSSGAPNSFFSIQGNGFPNNSPIQVDLSGTSFKTEKTVLSDENGNVSFILNTVHMPAGVYTITLYYQSIQQSSINQAREPLTASLSITIDPSAPLRDKEDDGQEISAYQFIYLPAIVK